MLLRKESHCISVVLLLTFMGACFLTSCVSTKSAVYLHEITDTVITLPEKTFEPVIQKNDILQINVSSLNPEDAIIYNASNTPSTGNSASGVQAMGGFLVDQQGFIQYPVLGPVKVEGMSKKSLTSYLREQLIQRKLLVDPVVSVRFLNYRVTMLGEVGKPAVINVTNERISILEALGLAGDITVYGRKENVLLIRDEEGKRTVKRLNLNDRNLLTSPYYYLQSNDVVYVEPNKAKVANGDRTRQILPIVLSGLSLAIIALDRLILR